MKFKGFAALLLCAALAFSLMTGCANTAVQDASPSPLASDAIGAPSASPSAAADTLNRDGAYAAFSPDETVLTVDGTDIKWSEAFYLINYYVNYVESTTGSAVQWSEEIADGQTTADFVKAGAVDWEVYAAAVTAGAKELGVTLTDEDISAIDTAVEEQIEEAGGAEAFEASLAENYCTMELFKALSKAQRLADKCFAAAYGETGEKLTDAEVAENIEGDGYMMAKHILLSTLTTDDEGNSVSVSAAEKTAAYNKIRDIKDKLDACSPEELDAKFDELMKLYSEDTGGLQYFPQGFLFQSGDIDETFEAEVGKLNEGEYSDVTETAYGYQIFYRVPLNYDTVPYAYAGYLQQGYENYTLRYITALSAFQSIVSGWKDAVEVKYTDAFNSLDLAAIYSFG